MKKGPVLATAIIAGIHTFTDGHTELYALLGTMAAKKTSELIPFCHPVSACRVGCVLVHWFWAQIPVDSCKFSFEFDSEGRELLLDCTVSACCMHSSCIAVSRSEPRIRLA